MFALALRWTCLVAATAVDVQTVVSKSGCTCLSKCGASYVKPHHDTDFCYVDPSECREGCDCHLLTPDSSGRPWDLCDPRHTMETAWMEAPAFAQAAYQKTAAKTAATTGQVSQAATKESQEKAATTLQAARNATDAAEKRERLAAEAAKQQLEEVKKKEFLAMTAEKRAFQKMQSRLTTSLVASVVIAICAFGFAASMLPRYWQSSVAKQQLADATLKVALLENEKMHLTGLVHMLQQDIGDQRSLLSKHQDVVMELVSARSARSESLPDLVERLHQGRAMNNGLVAEWAMRHHAPVSTGSTECSDGEESPDARGRQLAKQSDDLPTARSTTISTGSSRSKPSDALENSGERPVANVDVNDDANVAARNIAVPPLNLQYSLSKEALTRFSSLAPGEPLDQQYTLQESLLNGSSWQKLGDEAWEQNEFEGGMRDIGHYCDTVHESKANPTPRHHADVIDIDGQSICSHRSDVTSSSVAWWGGTSFSDLGNLGKNPDQCRVSVREARLLAKQKRHPERYLIHTPGLGH